MLPFRYKIRTNCNASRVPLSACCCCLMICRTSCPVLPKKYFALCNRLNTLRLLIDEFKWKSPCFCLLLITKQRWREGSVILMLQSNNLQHSQTTHQNRGCSLHISGFDSIRQLPERKNEKFCINCTKCLLWQRSFATYWMPRPNLWLSLCSICSSLLFINLFVINATFTCATERMWRMLSHSNYFSSLSDLWGHL